MSGYTSCTPQYFIFTCLVTFVLQHVNFVPIETKEFSECLCACGIFLIKPLVLCLLSCRDLRAPLWTFKVSGGHE